MSCGETYLFDAWRAYCINKSNLAGFYSMGYDSNPSSYTVYFARGKQEHTIEKWRR